MSTYFAAGPGWPPAPDACAGCLVLRDVSNPQSHPELESHKAVLLEELRRRYAGMTRAAIAAQPPVPAYMAYYRRFEKSYHVLAQIESIALKGKDIPRVAALVEAMFMTELDDLLLTAGHDLDSPRLPVTVLTAEGSERYTVLRGEEKTAVAGDMIMRDGEGVVSTVIHGPDRRTAITPATRNALFAVYAPAGVGSEAVLAHLDKIAANVRVISPGARVECREVL
jgi:DNA/RNA-binding domain of Phe-tRNA-synthetase-like protein